MLPGLQHLTLPWHAKGAVALQTYPMVNRGVLDITGAAGPMIALARNKTERKERILERSIVIGSVFGLAPLHAILFRSLESWRIKLPRSTMGISFRNLTSETDFKHSLQTTIDWYQHKQQKAGQRSRKFKRLGQQIDKLKAIISEKKQFWSIQQVDDFILFQSLDRVYVYNAKDETIKTSAASPDSAARCYTPRWPC